MNDLNSGLIIEFSVEHFGSWFKQQRRLRNLYLAEVAYKAEVSLGHLSRLENERSKPTILIASRLIEAIGLEFTVRGK